jgi:hypothetical protein
VTRDAFRARAAFAAAAAPWRIAAEIALGAALSVSLVACGGSKGGRSDYVQDADTGAAAPATKLTPDNPAAPNSTAGVSERTGKPGVAGDTLGSKGAAAGGAAGRGRRP